MSPPKVLAVVKSLSLLAVQAPRDLALLCCPLAPLLPLAVMSPCLLELAPFTVALWKFPLALALWAVLCLCLQVMVK